MKKVFATLLSIFAFTQGFTQYIQVDYTKGATKSFYAAYSKVDESTAAPKPEIFKSGFLDFLDNGSIQASARVVRLFIGEPKGFHIPFLIYSGIAGQAFGNNNDNKTTIASLLNPIGGIANFSFANNHDLLKNNATYTKLQFSYQLGGRLVNGTDTTIQKGEGFFNGFSNAGIYFQTGAWENADDIGMFWAQAKASFSTSSKSKLRNFFGDVESGMLYGYTLDAGLAVNKVINFKFSVYQYINNSDIGLLNKPIVKFSLDYEFPK